MTLRTHYGRHVCKCISHFNLFSPFFQCHMQNRPAAADAGVSVGVINTNTHSTKYHPHSPAYKTSACNAKICGKKFTTLFQIHTHGNMRSYTDRCDAEKVFEFIRGTFCIPKTCQVVTPQVCVCLHACHCAACMYAWVTLCTQVQTSDPGVDICVASLMHPGSHFLYTMPLNIVQTSTGATSLHPSEPLQCANSHWVACIRGNGVVNMGSGKGYHTQ